MHDLHPLTALGEADPRVERFSHVTIRENDGLALASVAARRGIEQKCYDALTDLLGAVPGPGKAVHHVPISGFWIGPDQWMISAPRDTHDLLADQAAVRLGKAASVTEQTGAWVCFDIAGSAMADLCERLCAVPIRTMAFDDAQRSSIHQLGCFVLRHAEDQMRILGPRASSQSLHHALVTAAHSVA